MVFYFSLVIALLIGVLGIFTKTHKTQQDGKKESLNKYGIFYIVLLILASGISLIKYKIDEDKARDSQITLNQKNFQDSLHQNSIILNQTEQITTQKEIITRLERILMSSESKHRDETLLIQSVTEQTSILATDMDSLKRDVFKAKKERDRILYPIKGVKINVRVSISMTSNPLTGLRQIVTNEKSYDLYGNSNFLKKDILRRNEADKLNEFLSDFSLELNFYNNKKESLSYRPPNCFIRPTTLVKGTYLKENHYLQKSEDNNTLQFLFQDLQTELRTGENFSSVYDIINSFLVIRARSNSDLFYKIDFIVIKNETGLLTTISHFSEDKKRKSRHYRFFRKHISPDQKWKNTRYQ